MWRRLESQKIPVPMLNDCLLVHSYTRNELYKDVSALLNNNVHRVQNNIKVKKATQWTFAIKRAFISIQQNDGLSAWKYSGTLYRGIRYAFPNLKEQFKKGSLIAWYTLKSTSCSEAVMGNESFCGKDGDRTIFEIQEAEGLNIAQLSEYPTESEILLPPGTYFEVIETIENDKKYGCPLAHADRVKLKFLGSDIGKLLDALKDTRVMMVGNPRVGKSALLNYLCQDAVFTSKASESEIGSGVTRKLKVHTHHGKVYMDTPGAADNEDGGEHRAAIAVFQALMWGGCFQIFVVMRENSGGFSPEDGATAKALQEACSDLPDFKFTVILNMCPRRLTEDTQRQIQQKRMIQHVLGAQCCDVLFFPMDEDMAYAENKIWNLTDSYKLSLERASVTVCDTSKIKSVNFTTVKELAKQFEKQMDLARKKTARDRRILWWTLAIAMVLAAFLVYIIWSDDEK